MNREVHVRFWERPGVRVPGPTQHSRRLSRTEIWSAVLLNSCRHAAPQRTVAQGHQRLLSGPNHVDCMCEDVHIMPRGRLFSRLDKIVQLSLRAWIFVQFSALHDHGQIGSVLDKRHVLRWIAPYQKKVSQEPFFDQATLVAKSHEFSPDNGRAT